MRGLTLRQPYAGLVALGHKRYETRTWQTKYRGLVAIHAGTAFLHAEQTALARVLKLTGREHDADFGEALTACGHVVALAELASCQPILPELVAELDSLELAGGHWTTANYAWRLENVRPLAEPYPLKGKQRLFRLRDRERREVLARAGVAP